MTKLKDKLEETQTTANEMVNQAKETLQEKQTEANEMVNQAKSKLNETQTEANQSAAQAKDRLEQKKTVANGRFTQAKGVAKEKWGQITNNEALQRTGKIEQGKGHLQATYGNSWAARNKETVMAIAAVVAFITFFFARKSASTS